MRLSIGFSRRLSYVILSVDRAAVIANASITVRGNDKCQRKDAIRSTVRNNGSTEGLAVVAQDCLVTLVVGVAVQVKCPVTTCDSSQIHHRVVSCPLNRLRTFRDFVQMQVREMIFRP